MTISALDPDDGVITGPQVQHAFPEPGENGSAAEPVHDGSDSAGATPQEDRAELRRLRRERREWAKRARRDDPRAWRDLP